MFPLKMLKNNILIIICILLWASTIPVMAVKKREGNEVFAVNLVRSEAIGSETYCGLEPGTTFPMLVFKDYNGKTVNLASTEKKLFIAYDYFFVENNLKYVYYEKLARQHADRLQVVILFQGTPSKNVATKLQNAGVLVVPNFIQAQKYLKQDHSPFVYLVDEKKVVQCRYRFTYNYWKNLDQATLSFVKTGKIPANLTNAGSFLTLGETVDTSSFGKDLAGVEVLTSKLRGKPSVLFFLPSPEAIPTMEALAKKYKDQVNLVVIIWYMTEEKKQEVVDLYKYVGQNLDMNDSALKPDLESVTAAFEPFKESSSRYILIPDKDGQLCYLFNMHYSSSVMVLDQNLQLIEGLSLARGVFENAEEARKAPRPDEEIIRILTQIKK